jgi:hypothetical protein
MANLIIQWTQINGLKAAPLIQQVKNFNDPNLSNINITFNGVMSEVYRWEQRVRTAIQLHNMPDGTRGALHNSFNGTIGQINFGGKPNWQALQYNTIPDLNVPANAAGVAPVAAVEVYIEQRPPLNPQNSVCWANPLLDGIELVNGHVRAHIFNANGTQDTVADPTNPHSVTHSYPEIRGKFSNAITEVGPPEVHHPQNRCERSQKFVNKILEGFRGTAVTWLENMRNRDVNMLPRCFENHRWEGQTVSPNNIYGLFLMVKKRFIPASVKEATFLKIEQMTIYNYERPLSETGKPEMRNMATFTEVYREALYIAELDYGSIEIQRQIFGKN